MMNRQERDAFLGAFTLRIASVEREIPRIARQPKNVDAAAALLRTTYQARRDAEASHLGSVATLLRGIESLAQALTDRRLTFVPAVGETILLALDRAKVAAEGQTSGATEDGELERAAGALDHLARGGDSNRDADVASALAALTGSDEWSEASKTTPGVQAPESVQSSAVEGPHEEDLLVFRELSLRLERRSQHWQGRTDRLVRLALVVNAEQGNRVDPRQLEAAVYMHDTGMAFLSESFWNQKGRLEPAEFAELQGHPLISASILSRLPRWAEATQIVAQHHERLNGKGYPRGLKDAEIVPGAKLIAIIDAFEAMTHERVDRKTRKSFMRAIAEINACVDQFAREWVAPFNVVARRILLDPKNAAEMAEVGEG